MSLSQENRQTQNCQDHLNISASHDVAGSDSSELLGKILPKPLKPRRRRIGQPEAAVSSLFQFVFESREEDDDAGGLKRHAAAAAESLPIFAELLHFLKTTVRNWCFRQESCRILLKAGKTGLYCEKFRSTMCPRGI